MKTAKFKYRCRGCKAKHDGLGCGEKFALHYLCNAIGDTPSKEIQAPKIYDIHNCKDGRVCVSDLIGYEVV